jgi:hypothetical protein
MLKRNMILGSAIPKSRSVKRCRSVGRGNCIRQTACLPPSTRHGLVDGGINPRHTHRVAPSTEARRKSGPRVDATFSLPWRIAAAGRSHTERIVAPECLARFLHCAPDCVPGASLYQRCAPVDLDLPLRERHPTGYRGRAVARSSRT